MLGKLWRATLMGCLLSACAHGAASAGEGGEAAWAAWRAGAAGQALELAQGLIGEPATADEGHHVAALASHVSGAHDAALSHYRAISEGYARRREVRGPVFESLLHANRAEEALRFAQETQMSANAQARAQARVDNPMRVTIPGIVALPFTEDAATPFLPGLAGRLNGAAATFRLDTGGTFVAMSPALAERYGVRSRQCERGFANLQASQVCNGVADLDLGPVHIANAPVVVVSSLPGEILGVELGPVLGTNFFEQFLTTIHAPRGMIVLSPRGNEEAGAQHRGFVGSGGVEVPFLLWSDHFMIARGGAGARRDLNFFVDSGLVAIDNDGVQAGLLASQSEAAAWGGFSGEATGAIAPLSPPIFLGGAEQSGQRAMVLPDAGWSAFGQWGGIGVNALISQGFLKHYAWTLDFDRQIMTLSQ